jgi:hypothetical protein
MKQCKEYYEALDRGDVISAHYLRVIPPLLDPVIEEMKRRAEALWDEYKAEQEYIENLPKELLDFEEQYQKNKRRKI